MEDHDPIATPAIKIYFPDLIELKMNLYNNLMFVHIKLEEFDKAIDKGLEAMQINSNHCKTIFRLGQAQFYKKEYEKAVTLFSQAIKINKKDEIIRKFYEDACQLYREEMRSMYKIKNKFEVMEI